MKIQNNKTKAATILASLIVGLALVSPTVVLPNVGAQTPSSIPTDSCMQQMEKAIFDEKSKLDQDKMNSTALGYSDFHIKVANDNFKYQSMYGIFSLDIPNCTAKLKTVHVAFSVHDKNGKERQVTVTEDPVTLSPTDTTVTDMLVKHSTPSNIWSGYEMMGSSTPRSVPVYEAQASWNVPSVSQPYSGACPTNTNFCDMSTWPGLTSFAGGNDGSGGHIVQAGTESIVYNCSTSCVTLYSAWFEYFPDSPTVCNGMTNLTAGDFINTDVYSEGKTGGTVSNYDITVSDTTQSQACSNIVNPHSFSAMGTPYYAQYINEKGGGLTLPKFGSITMAGTIYYSGASRGINLPYSGGWYNLYEMDNGGFTNIGVGSVGSSGQFAQTWLTSSGT